MQEEKSLIYEPPVVEVISIEVEQGFAATINGWNDGGSSEGTLDF